MWVRDPSSWKIVAQEGSSLREARMRRQEGFSLIEVLVSIVMLALVAGGLAAGMVAASRQIGGSRVDNAASNVAQGTLDRISASNYDDLGLPAGNPPGTLTPTTTVTRGSVSYRVDTTVTYEDDQAGGQPRLYANYKRVTVTVTPLKGINPVPTTSTKLFSPPSAGAVRDKATAIVSVQDSLLGTPIQGASVLVDGSTSSPRTDFTDATGKAVFGLLEPATSGPPLDFYHFTVTKTDYVTHADSVGLKLHLTAGQTGSPVIKMFKPAKIIVNLTDRSTGTPITEFSTVTVKTPDPGSLTEAKQGTASPVVFTTVGGDPIEPRSAPFIVTAASDCYGTATQSSPVPVGYPGNTDQIFNFTFDPKPHGNLTVQIVDNGTGSPIAGASVQVSGGGPNIAPRLRTTGGAGTTSYCLEPSGALKYLVSVTAPNYNGGAAFQSITVGGTPTLQIRISKPVGATCTIILDAHQSGLLVRLRHVAAPGIPAYDSVQPTDGTGKQTFVGLTPANNYYASYNAGFSGGGDPTWSSPELLVGCTSGTTKNYTVK